MPYTLFMKTGDRKLAEKIAFKLCGREVTKEEFYRTVGRLDVHPHIVNSYERKGRGYVAEWRVRGTLDKLVGVTESGDFPFQKPRYFVLGAL